jgi:hypothetical protein
MLLSAVVVFASVHLSRLIGNETHRIVGSLLRAYLGDFDVYFPSIRCLRDSVESSHGLVQIAYSGLPDKWPTFHDDNAG